MARVARPVVALDGLYAYLAEALAVPRGEPIEVPHYDLPDWARIPRPGRSTGHMGVRVRVLPDDTISVREVMAAEWLRDNGL